MSTRWSTAWVTGASTGIGRELALRLATRGVRVAASARNVEKLAELSALNHNITAYPVDVSNAQDVAGVHARILKDFGTIDLAVLNAGVWDLMDVREFNAGRVAQAMAINFGGITNALEPLLATMLAKNNGHIALVASVSGYRGLPKAAAYAPSKAAVISLAEVLRVDLAQTGITVSLINPGFVDTPMTSVNTFPMPFMISTSAAVDHIVSGLEKQRFEIAFPWQLVTMLKALRVLPYRLYFAIVTRLLSH